MHALQTTDGGDILFAGVATRPWVGGFPPSTLVGRLDGASGNLAWLHHHVDPQVLYAHVNALALTPDGLLRIAGMDADAGLPLQAVIAD